MILSLHQSHAELTAAVHVSPLPTDVKSGDEKQAAAVKKEDIVVSRVLRYDLGANGIRYVKTAADAQKINQERLLKLKERGVTELKVRNLYIPMNIDSKGQQVIIYINFHSAMKNLLFASTAEREDAYRFLLDPHVRDSLDSIAKKKDIKKILSGTCDLPESEQAQAMTAFVWFRLLTYYNKHKNMELRRKKIDNVIAKPITPALAQKIQLASNRIIYDPKTALATRKSEMLSSWKMNLSRTISRDDEVARKNFLEADKLICSWAMAKQPLTIEMIAEINRIVGKQLEFNKMTPGVIRGFGQELNSGKDERYNYLTGKHVKPELEKFIKWVNESIAECEAGLLNPVLVAAQAAVRLVSIHPFFDGNGRTSRLVMDYILQRFGLPPAVLPNAEMAVFGDLPDKLNVTMESAIEKVKVGIQNSCRLLNIRYPFVKHTLTQKIASLLCTT